MQAAHRGLGRADLGEGALEVAVVEQPRVGQAEAARRTPQQRHAEPAFQPRHLAAHGGDRQAERAAGGGESTCLHHLGEDLQLIESGSHCCSTGNGAFHSGRLVQRRQHPILYSTCGEGC
jgi:hypothetical protein